MYLILDTKLIEMWNNGVKCIFTFPVVAISKNSLYTTLPMIAPSIPSNIDYYGS